MSDTRTGKAVILIPQSSSKTALREDELDTLEEASLIANALGRLGFPPLFLDCGLNLDSLASSLRKAKPLFCFNCVEQLGGSGALQHLVPSLLESMGIPFSGTGASGLLLTTDKVLTKRLLKGAGLETPNFFADGSFNLPEFIPGQFIVKPVSEDASVGIDDQAVVSADSPARLNAAIRAAEQRHGFRFFAEEFVDGREFNLSLLQQGDQFEVLPPAELLFENFADDKPQIVGYNAKWNEESFEYNNIVRRNDFSDSDREMVDRMAQASLACGNLFGLQGYFRIDFRTRGDEIFLIDVNANPGIGKDSGFVFAAERAGIEFDGIIARIVKAALASAKVEAAHDLALS